MRQKNVQMVLEDNKNNWDEIADKFSQTRHHLWFEFADFKDYIKKGDKVLDLGCGNGRLIELFDKDIDYLGVDQSQKLIEAAKKRFPSGKFFVADALNLPFKKKFDVIFSIAFFHHIPSQDLRLKILKDCYSFLAPKGIFICLVWNLFQPRLIWKYNLGKIIFGFKNVLIPFKIKEQKIKRYYYAFTKGELKRFFKKTGFKIIKCYYVRKGRLASRLNGYNLILIAKKDD